MSALQRAVATLRIAGDDLVPAEVSTLLGAEPTYSQVNGQALPSKSPSGIRIAKFGQWRLEAIATEPEDVNSQVSELLAHLTPSLETWRVLSQRYKIDLFCGWYMGEQNEGVEISSGTLSALGARGIGLSLDIYAPEPDA